MKTFDDESEITDSNNGVDGANVLGNMPDFNTHIEAANANGINFMDDVLNKDNKRAQETIDAMNYANNIFDQQELEKQKKLEELKQYGLTINEKGKVVSLEQSPDNDIVNQKENEPDKDNNNPNNTENSERHLSTDEMLRTTIQMYKNLKKLVSQYEQENKKLLEENKRLKEQLEQQSQGDSYKPKSEWTDEDWEASLKEDANSF